jgi:hypothetical protein
MHSFSLLSLVVLHHLVIYVSADTSLFIPGFDPQPLSVGDLGTDGQGRTTWEIVPGSLTGTFSEPAFIGTATLVEGPNDAHLVYNNAELSITMDVQCGINNGNAVCTGDSGYEITPLIFPTQPAEPFVVQGGGPLTASSQATPSGSSVLPAQTPKSSGFITTTPAPSTSATSSGSPSSAGSNDARSNIVVQIPLVVALAVMTVVLV